MYLKKILVSGLTVCLLAAGSPAFADENNNVEVSSNVDGNIEAIDLQNGFENLSEDMVVSDVLTFDELVAVMAKEEGITAEEASNIIISNSGAKIKSNDSNLMAAKSATYRTLTKTLNDFSDYKPTLNFYCETSESGSFRGIVKILNTSLDPIYYHNSKRISYAFIGTIYVNLEHANKIHYEVSGKYYKESGITSVTGNASVSIGGAITLGISATAATGYMGTVFNNGNVLF
ncbi:hypothetical protein ASD24_09225 [Paenibacillus sp. Root52]|uniref:Uncharacterized protein n=1 Tax=Paenibacillus amylolyticus TaxID=1451 RepID=A0AAP5LRJ4_PAEAM|nr:MULTISPECIES: hypothetical protein [Paenibacillus]KQY83973.1 hypothetical protein ASD24_09225 [Paenibacillus sp. Root52]MDR6726648.1 hypothetical protein [Paenibacillus amylolyticus]